MAEDASIRRKPHVLADTTPLQDLTCVILSSLCDELKSDDKMDRDVGLIMRESLTKAGVEYQGAEALRIHAAILTHTFVHPQNQLDSSSPCGPSCGSVCASLSSTISAQDYFSLLVDEELGWLAFFNYMLPYLRMPVAVPLLEEVVLFFSRDCLATHSLSRVHLLVSALTVMLNIVLDVLPSETQPPASLPDNSCDRKSPDRNTCPDMRVPWTDVKDLKISVSKLANLADKCLDTLLKLLSTTVSSSLLLPSNSNCLSNVVRVLFVTSSFLDPFSCPSDVTSNMTEWRSRRKFPHWSQRREKKIRSAFKNSKVVCKDDDFEMTEIVLKKEGLSEVGCCDMEKEEREEEEGSCSCTVLQNRRDAGLRVNVIPADVESENGLQNSVQAKKDATSSTFFSPVLAIFRRNVSFRRYFDIIKCFSEGLFAGQAFSKPLRDIILDTQTFSIGRHVLKGKELIPNVLQGFVKATRKGRELPECSPFSQEISDLLASWTHHLPEDFSDLDRLRLSDVELFLATGRALDGPGDLEFVQTAVQMREKGWVELLALGLRNSDVLHWWGCGFYQLVWLHEAALSSECHVGLVLNVLRKAALTLPADAALLNNLRQLFSVMFGRLPTLLQELLVLAATITKDGSTEEVGHQGDQAYFQEIVLGEKADGRGAGMTYLKSETEVLEELTALLNKLTSANVDKMMSPFLQLCLSGTSVVLRELVSGAVENKGQVDPVVEVLRRMPSICCALRVNADRSQLCDAVCEVLRAAELTEARAKNYVRLVTLLVSDYTHTVDAELCLSLRRDGVLALSELLNELVVPRLDAWTQTHSRPRVLSSAEDGEKDGEKQTQRCEAEGGSGTVEREGVNTQATVSEETAFIKQTETSLQILCNLLQDIAPERFKQLQPLTLCVAVADTCVSSYDVVRNGEMDRGKARVKQAACRCVGLLTENIVKHSAVISDRKFQWLRKVTCRSGWLHVALLFPVFHDRLDDQMTSSISLLVQRVLSHQNDTVVDGLTLLFQLAVVNERIFARITTALGDTGISISWACLSRVLNHMLLMSSPLEMGRLVAVLACVLTRMDDSVYVQSKADFISHDADQGRELSECVASSRMLMEAVLALLLWEPVESVLCHILSNYQAAVQAILSRGEPDVFLLATTLGHCMRLLSEVTGEAARILQVSALNIFAALKAPKPVATATRRKLRTVEEKAQESKEKFPGGYKGDKEAGRRRRKESREILRRVRSHVWCVKESGVRELLSKRLTEILEGLAG